MNRRTRIRDQERSPIAADLEASDGREIPKRQKDPCTHSRCGRGPPTSANPPAGLAHARVPGEPRRSSIRPYCGEIRSGVRVLLLVAGRGGDRPCHAVLFWKQSGHVACYGCRRLPPRGRRSRVSPRTPRLLRCLSVGSTLWLVGTPQDLLLAKRAAELCGSSLRRRLALCLCLRAYLFDRLPSTGQLCCVSAAPRPRLCVWSASRTCSRP